MYIVYDTKQEKLWSLLDGNNDKPEGPTNDSTFKPTWLVRTSDMQVVPGFKAKSDGYWALSYSWNQSGEVVKEGHDEYRRVDKALHIIIRYKTVLKSSSSSWNDASSRFQKATHHLVTFAGLVQQICKDFGIRYIWYDQMCVDQSDHAKKVYEIQRMHKIYQHAFCTIALVPELEFLGVDKTGSRQANIDVITTSEWSKRMWTLEEAYMSRNILFIGRNTHLLSRTARYYVGPSHLRAEAFLFNICTPFPNWRASTALWFTRSRNSSKAHDRIFALANIFPDLMADIQVDYKQPLLDLMIKFYGLLAQKDLSVLCFGSPIDSDTSRQSEANLLPSWTGVFGGHIPQKSDNEKHLRTRFTNYNVSGRYIRCQSCNCIPITIVSAEPRERSSSTETKEGLPYYSPSEDDYTGLYHIRPRENANSLLFVNTTATSQDDHNYRIKTFALRATHFLPMSYNYRSRQEENDWLNEPYGSHVGGWLSITEDCSECFMLSEMPFSIDGDHWYAFPVIKKNGGHYKSIGVCVTRGIYLFDGSLRQRLADFIIQ